MTEVSQACGSAALLRECACVRACSCVRARARGHGVTWEGPPHTRAASLHRCVRRSASSEHVACRCCRGAAGLTGSRELAVPSAGRSCPACQTWPPPTLTVRQELTPGKPHMPQRRPLSELVPERACAISAPRRMLYG